MTTPAWIPTLFQALDAFDALHVEERCCERRAGRSGRDECIGFAVGDQFGADDDR